MLSFRPRLAVSFLLALLAAGRAFAANVPVTSTADTNTAGTLRNAINVANAADTITFSIGSGLQTITVGSALPTVSKSITIDGTSQPGYAGTPLIVINGNGVSASGLSI